MVSDPKHKTSSLRLENISAFNHSKSFKPPKLRFFRALQLIALVLALIWLTCALLVSRYLIGEQLNDSLRTSNNYVVSEVGHLVDALSQNLYRAEQLSKTLSFDQSMIALAESAKNNSTKYNSLAPEARLNYILNMPGAIGVNALFEQLANNVDVHQILLLDDKGYCVGSSRAKEPNGCIGMNYQTRDYFNKAKNEGSGRQFAIGRVVPVPSFFFATAIKKDGEFFGAVVVRQELQQITGFLHHQKALTFITGMDGIILNSSQNSLVYKYIGAELSVPLDLKKFQDIFHRDTVESLQLDRVSLPFGNSSFGNAQPGTLPLVKMDGKTYLLGKASVEGGDFNVFILENVDSAISGYYNSWKLAITITVLGLLLILTIERNFNHSQHRIAHLNALSDANKNLEILTDELYELSVTDALTGISNRRFFRARLQEEINHVQRRNSFSSYDDAEPAHLTLAIIDIDSFKKINDTFGHPAGDQAILTMANICVDAVRQYDCVGRIGGEEFGILLTDTGLAQASEIAERIRNRCENHVIQFEDFNFTQTCSIGLAAFKQNDSIDSLLSKADKALYEAKRAGKNRFVCAD